MPESNGGSVLIVENEDSLFQSVGKVLEDAGFEVSRADDFVSAGQLILNGGFAAVISEIKIGEDFVLDLIKKVRASKYSSLPFVVLSPTKNPKVVAAAVKAGADDFIVKPFSPDILNKKLRAAIEKRRRSLSPDTRKFIAAGEKCVEQKRLQDALALFSKAVRLDPEAAEAYAGLANICLVKRDVEQYKKLALKAAGVHARRDDFQEARDLVMQVRQYDENAPNPYKIIGREAAAQGRTDEGLKALQKAALMDPEDPEIYKEQAEIHAKLGNLGKAMSNISGALKLQDDYQEARKLYQALAGERWSENPQSKAGQERIAEEERRGTVRFWTPDLLAEVKGRKEHFPLSEMSLNSIGFNHRGIPFQEGEELSLDIIRVSEGEVATLIKKLKARVARIDTEVVGCMSENMSEEQRKAVSELIKEAQRKQKEIKEQEALDRKDVSFDLDMLFL
jgi:two-component system chemotaxis response regulator CheY